MKYSHKKLFLNFTFICLIAIVLSTLVYFVSAKNSNSVIEFESFMNLYTSKNIESANKYILNDSLPDINNIFSIAIEQCTNNSQREIIHLFENLFYSIKYNVVSSKILLNKATLNVNFTYYDLSKHIINFFKNAPDNEINYEKFISSLENSKYKISTNLDIKLVQKNNQWNIILSEKLLNILTSGIYKNFTI
mgnify:CR=1 FL=1